MAGREDGTDGAPRRAPGGAPGREGPRTSWAEELLDQLRPAGRDVRGTLRTWITAGGNSERAAQLLGIHAQTVREHVRGVEPVLERQLLAAGSDLYEVVLAHLAVGDLDPPALEGA